MAHSVSSRVARVCIASTSHMASLAAMAATLGLLAVPAAAETWNNVANASWGSAAEWTPATVPNAVDAVADFNAVDSSSFGVSLSGGPFTVGTLNLNNAVDGGFSFQNGTLIMEVAAGTAAINVETANSLQPDFFNNGLLQLNSNTVVDTIDDADFTVATAISGTGGLEKTGEGSMTLLGANTYTGLTDVTGGTLTVNGAIAGDSEVSDGEIILDTGANLADGSNVEVSGTGVLSVFVADTVGSVDQLGGTIDGSATLTTTTFDQSGGELAGIVSASGAKTLNGGTISGTLDGAGATTIQTGITTVTGSIVGDVTVAGGGTLHIDSADAVTGSITTTGSVISYANGIDEASAIILNSNTTQLQVLGTDEAEQSGNISELGGARPLEKIGSGKLTLSGANTFTGDLTITGGTLVASGLSAVDDSVKVVLGAGTTFEVFASEAIGALDSAAADAQVNIGERVLRIAGGQNTTYAGKYTSSVFGSGGILTNSGTGELNMTGDGSGFTASLSANGAAAVISVTGSGTTGAKLLGAISGATFKTDGGAILSSIAVLRNTGKVIFTGSETVDTITDALSTGLGTGTIELTGAGTILTVKDALNAGSLGINGSSGIISGTGGLRITGGTFALSGANTYAGLTTVAGGKLVVTNPSGLGSTAAGTVVESGATLEIDLGIAGATSEALTLSGTGVGGTGALRHVGTFSNNIDGLVTLAAATQINSEGGGLQFTNGITGTNQNLTIDGAGSTRISSVLAIGSGTLTKNGAGQLNMNSANTFTGATTVNAGVLEVTNGSALSDTAVLTVNAPAVAKITRSETIGGLAGDGSVVLGQIFTGATLNISPVNTDHTFAGVISEADPFNPSALQKSGNGTQILTGINTYKGVTNVNEGRLEITGAGSVASGSVGVGTSAILLTDGAAFTAAPDLTVNGQWTLTGSETVKNIVRFGGAIALQTNAAGDQTLTVNGNLTGGNGLLALDANLGGPGSLSDKLIVLGDTTGTTRINIKDSNISPGAFNPGGIALVQVTGTTAADHFTLQGGPINKGLFTYSLALDGKTHELVSALNASAQAPAIAVAGAQSLWDDATDAWATRQDALRDSLNGPVITAVADPVSVEDVPHTLWLSGLGSWKDRDAKGSSLAYEQDTYGIMGGADFGTRLGDDSTLLFGLMAGYLGSDMDIADGFGSGVELEGGNLGAYASLHSGNLFANVMLGANVLTSDIKIGNAPKVKVDTTTIGLRSDVGYHFEAGNGLFLEPMVSLSASSTDMDSFNVAGVTFADSSNDMFLLGGGARIGLKADAVNFAMTARIWNNLSGNNELNLTPIGPALTVTDSGLFDGTFGEVEGHMNVNLTDNASLFAKANVKFDSDATALSGQAGVAFKW